MLHDVSGNPTMLLLKLGHGGVLCLFSFKILPVGMEFGLLELHG